VLFLILVTMFGRFFAASDIDMDIEGNSYVVDRQGNMLVKYSARGDSLRAVSGFGGGSLQFDGPVAVYARRGNDVFVADYNNHRIQRFDRLLDYVTSIYTRDDPDQRQRFGYPRDLAVSRQGDILIVDGENRRIIKFNSFGKYLSSFGDITAGEGRLGDPSQIELDDNDNAYVLDRGRIAVFDPFGGYVRDLVLPTGVGSPRAISIDRDTLVAADSLSVTFYDIKTRTPIEVYGIEPPPVALRYVRSRIIAAGEHRVGVYALDSEQIRPVVAPVPHE
jgi:hypothetical protein